MIVEKLNHQLDEIWDRQFSNDGDVLVPRYYHSLEPIDLLFVGLNPSFSEENIRKALSDIGIEEPKKYFSWRNRTNFDKAACAKLERWALENYTYFQHHRQFAADLERTWAQLDLYQFRRTDQKDYLKFLDQMPAFRDSQLEIFDEALKQSRPKAIIIANAKASDKIKEKYLLRFNPDTGHHNMEINGRMTPVFLSGQFSGGALDKYSRERLFWLVEMTLNGKVTVKAP